MAHAISQGIVGERLATLKNIMMAHRAKGTFSGQFENGELESQLQLFKKIVRTMEQRNANRIGISLKAYKSNVINEWWSYGSQSKKLNIVDKLVSLICSKELINKKRSSTRMTILGPMEGPEKSQCPLIP
jgi:ATP-dependent protease ClpP protease subunit